jgi:hypothetical protein
MPNTMLSPSNSLISGNIVVEKSSIIKRDLISNTMRAGLGAIFITTTFYAPPFDISTNIVQNITQGAVINVTGREYTKNTIYTDNFRGVEEYQMTHPPQSKKIKSKVIRRELINNHKHGFDFPDEKIESIIKNKPFENPRIVKSTVTRGFLKK